MTTEYRARLICEPRADSTGPGAGIPYCHYCDHPRDIADGVTTPKREIVLDKTCATADEAREHAQAMRALVYGSEHRIHIERRDVTPWVEADISNPAQHCTADDCHLTISHTAMYCGTPQPRRCGCPFCYPAEVPA